MRRPKPENLDKPKNAVIQREAMEDIKDAQSSSDSAAIRYRDPNRDRTLGEADRTGRHFDEEAVDPLAEAPEDHEAH